ENSSVKLQNVAADSLATCTRRCRGCAPHPSAPPSAASTRSRRPRPRRPGARRHPLPAAPARIDALHAEGVEIRRNGDGEPPVPPTTIGIRPPINPNSAAVLRPGGTGPSSTESFVVRVPETTDSGTPFAKSNRRGSSGSGGSHYGFRNSSEASPQADK